MDHTDKNGGAILLKRPDSNRQPEERHETMTDDPVDLDAHRGMAAQKATDIRRQRLHEFEADQAALRRRQEELEKLLLAAPAETWPEAAAKAQYLIQLFAATLEAQDPRRKELIAHALDDLTRLCDRAKEPS
ncbi:MAG: hypothetical protein OEM59_03485 [Rhodospirillales bacterium]|nr:hypothetical protein [Rhodospirillales bacterium]